MRQHLKVSSTLRQRFEAQIERSPCGCLLWKGAGDTYGAMYVGDKRTDLVHRVAWYLEYGVWPNDNLMHSCDNPLCVEIEHLSEGTQFDNLTDMTTKGRRAVGEVFGRGLTTSDVLDMRWLRTFRVPYYKIAELFGVTVAAAHYAISGKTWRHI